MPSKLEKAIKALAILTFFVPLVLISSKFIFPFIVPKILIFRSLVLLMLGCYVLLLRLNWQKYRPRRTTVNVAVGIFLFSLIVSTFVGVDWYKSFWDNHERMLGLFTLFHFVVYYLVLSSVIKEWREWRVLLRVFLFAGIIVMILGGIQKTDPGFLLNRGSGRVSATLGNAIYFSGYGLFLLSTGLLLAFKEEKKKRSFWFWYAVAGAFFGFLGIFWGGTRGTLLGFIAGTAVLLLTYLFTLREHKKLKLAVWVLFVISIIGIGLLFNFRRTEFVSRIPLVGRLFNFSITESTTETRLMAWKIAVEAWREKPVFGWGPNNYYYAFNKYYAPKFLEHGWGETWFDNAHSAVFNTLAVQGLFGILSYFLLFIVPAIALVAGFITGRIDKHVLAVGLAFLAGHFMHNATVFENPTSYLYFFFFLAFINQITDNKYGLMDNKIQPKEVSLGLGIAVCLVVLLLIYSTNINPARANMSALKTLKAASGTEDLGRSAYQKTLSLSSPHIDDIRSDYGRAVIQITSAVFGQNKNPSAEVRRSLEFSYDELAENRRLHPLDIRNHLQQAQIAAFLTVLNNDKRYLLRAEDDLDEALSISPKRQQVQYMLASVKLQLGKKEEAIGVMRESISNGPKVLEGWQRLQWMYQYLGDTESANGLEDEAKKYGLALSPVAADNQ